MGARMLGLDSERKPLHPQQYLVADVLNASDDDGSPLFSILGVCIPRRASKTTSIFAVALGRCMAREDYQVAFTAQSGTKARDRFLKDVVAPLQRKFPDGEGGFKINRSRGGEHIRFDNGSSMVVLPPQGDSFRGDAYDMVIIDEAQSQGPEEAAELKGAILPTFDTRPGAQLVVAGTTGKHRSGLLWDTLEDGRVGRASTGIVEYSAGDTLTEEELGDPETWQRAHPGIGTLTTLAVVERNYQQMSATPEIFAAEYLGVWPVGGGGRFLNPARWQQSAITGELPEPPERFALAFSVHPSGLSASIVAAWRDDDGLAHLGLIDHNLGTAWFAASALGIARRRKQPLVHDTYGGPNNVQVEILARAKPRPRLEPQTQADVKTAAALLVKEFDEGRLRHYDQEEMNTAAQLVIKRRIGNGWGLGRNADEEDITPLEAGALALRAFDGQRKRGGVAAIMAD